MTAQREWFEKDYYKTLGVADSATDKEITRAYRKLAKEHHPDANPGSEERFKEISAAYDVLGDTEKRKEYDEVRRLGPMAGGGGFGGGGFGGAGGFDPKNFRTEDVGDLSDLFGGMFGRGGRSRRQRGPQRGADIEAGLHLAFRDAVKGVTTSVNIPSDTRCSTCRGSGAEPGTTVTTCGRCGGSGSLNDDQGPLSLSTVCNECGGRGHVIKTPCSNCHGTGREKSTRSVKVRIPAGVEGGQRIRVKGRGTPGTLNGPAGDLFVTVHVGHDAQFGRSGRNLTTKAEITFPEAVLGTQITVATLDNPVTLKIPAGTAAGTTMRVKGRGVPGGSGRKAKPEGDLLVKIDVGIPKNLTDAQKAAVEALAASFAARDEEEVPA